MESKAESVPEAMRERYEAIVRMTDAVCDKYLNAEYAALARRLTAALARKRPSPLARGKPEVWACGVLYALGTVNFLWDKSQTPHLRADELCQACNVSPSTGSAKAKQIRDLFGMFQLDPRWTLPSLMDENPMAWLIMVDGLIIDARSAPLQVQKIAYEKGLIPYIPALKAQKEAQQE